MQNGIVTTATRRHVTLVDEDNSFHQCRTASRSLEPCVGDRVEFELAQEGALVRSIADRTNLLKRSYGRKTKLLAANVDLVCIVTGPSPLFNTSFIDRVLAATNQQQMKTILVVNKADLAAELKETEELIQAYEPLVARVVYTSAKQGTGIEEFHSLIQHQDVSIALLTGISGVGKSTLLNQLVPDANAKTSSVSEKTGQGRQTTSQSVAHLYDEHSKPQKLIIDLPGVQHFGLTHLSKQELRDGFTDFSTYSVNCQFANCTHINEPDCAVRQAVEEGKIAEWRLCNYQELIKERDSFPDY